MQVLIVKDSSTKVAKDVTLDQAREYRANGMDVLVELGDGQTQPLHEWEAAQSADVEESPPPAQETTSTPAKTARKKK